MGTSTARRKKKKTYLKLSPIERLVDWVICNLGLDHILKSDAQVLQDKTGKNTLAQSYTQTDMANSGYYYYF